jgi:DNA-binding beta-propeller fold protein YncE
MISDFTVGNGRFTYRVDDGWEQLPAGFSHLDVSGVAVDSSDRLFVFNRSEHPILVYEPDGRFVRSWGEGIFTDPHGLRIGGDDSVYGVDDFDHTVRKFAPDGQLVWVLGSKDVASNTGFKNDDYRTIVRGGPPFNRPTNLAISTSGDLYVTDGYGNARVHCFSGDGILKFSWGEPGSGPGQFNVPHAVTSDKFGRILVADRENNRIQVFSAKGQFVEEWTGLARPCDIAIDPGGFVFVAELGLYAGPYPFDAPPSDPTKHSRVSILDERGVLQARWGTADFAASGSFYAAHCLCLDSAGNLYVGEVNQAAGEGKVSRECHTLQRFVART